jgi:hypothetical protein
MADQHGSSQARVQRVETNQSDFRARLRQNLTDRFSEEELRTLCFDMGLDYESLPAQGKAGKAREIVAQVEREGATTKLIEQCRLLRPNVAWMGMPEMDSGVTTFPSDSLPEGLPSQYEIKGTGNVVGNDNEVMVMLTTMQQDRLHALIAELKRELEAAVDRIEHYPDAMAAVSEIEMHATQTPVNATAMRSRLEELRGIAERDDNIKEVINQLLSTLPPRMITITGDGNVIGDGNIVYILEGDFAGAYASLGQYCLDPSQVVEDVQLDHFVVRAALLREVDAFLDDPKGGYFVIEAQAGLGKTAFLAWLVKTRGYFQHFVRPEQGQDRALTCMQNLAAQIILACHLKPTEANDVFSAAKAQPEYLTKLLRMAIKKSPGQRIVVVIDAIDDGIISPSPNASNVPNVLNLPWKLPEGAYIIVSQRPVRVPLSTDPPDRRRTYLLQSDSPENEDAVRSYLREVASRPTIADRLDRAVPKLTKEQFADSLFKKSQGLWIYLHYLIPEIEATTGSPLDLDRLPEGIIKYYLNFLQGWCDRHEKEWLSHDLPLLATLAVAPGVVTADCLIRWAGVNISEAALTDLLNGPWCPFIIQIDKDEPSRFQFYHATLREIFTEQSVLNYVRAHTKVFVTAEINFVRALHAAANTARRRIIDILRPILLDPSAPFADRRLAVDQLIRLHWLEEAQFHNDLTVTMELIGPFLDSELVIQYLAARVEAVLSASDLAGQDRQRVHLLVYRAVLHGVLHELDKAEDCYERAGETLAILMASGTTQLEDYRWIARIELGKANILNVRAMQAEQTNPRRGRGFRRKAQEFYRLAAEAAQRYGRDPASLVNIEAEHCLNAAYLGDFAEAESARHKARAALAGITDPGAQTYYHAHLLETAGNMYYQWGKVRKTKRLAHYLTARDLAAKEIDLLDPDGPSEELVNAHINCAQYWLALAEYQNDPNSMATACGQWKIARDMAANLELSEITEEAQAQLDQHCPDQREGS